MAKELSEQRLNGNHVKWWRSVHIKGTGRVKTQVRNELAQCVRTSEGKSLWLKDSKKGGIEVGRKTISQEEARSSRALLLKHI